MLPPRFAFCITASGYKYSLSFFYCTHHNCGNELHVPAVLGKFTDEPRLERILGIPADERVRVDQTEKEHAVTVNGGAGGLARAEASASLEILWSGAC